MSDEYRDNKGNDNSTEEQYDRKSHRVDKAQDRVNQEENLLELLLRSSHFLHHRRGGKRGQGKILKLLSEHPQISQKELQELLGIESGSMSELVIKLEHKGFITRVKDEADKRMTTLKITEHGLELSKELEAEASREEQFLGNGLSAEEQEELKRLLSKLLSGWEESYEAFRGGRHHHKECGHHDHHDHNCQHSHFDKEGRSEHHGHHSHHDKEDHLEHHGRHKDHEHHSHHNRHGDHHHDRHQD
ncbi:MAG: MarR family transcriptional regulator [Herbinix sp.]|jgi:DNA-binding MarR family transcriptional regulator|nr:MarR family transcriptional regulator [Herbinix sp.]